MFAPYSSDLQYVLKMPLIIVLFDLIAQNVRWKYLQMHFHIVLLRIKCVTLVRYEHEIFRFVIIIHFGVLV